MSSFTVFVCLTDFKGALTDVKAATSKDSISILGPTPYSKVVCCPMCSTCRSRGCWDTACMACGLSRVWCRDTALLCSLGISHTTKSGLLTLTHKEQTIFAAISAACLPSGPGSVGSVSKSDSSIQMENSFTLNTLVFNKFHWNVWPWLDEDSADVPDFSGRTTGSSWTCCWYVPGRCSGFSLSRFSNREEMDIFLLFKSPTDV